MAQTRGPHRERTEQTTGALVAAARQRFAGDGYAATSVESVCAEAGVTKGALYHHFPGGKGDLFAAVFAAEQRSLTQLEMAAFRSQADAWTGFRLGCAAFLRASSEPGVQRITLLDAPLALGEEAWRAAQARSAALLARGLRAAMDQGSVPARDEQSLAELLHGALCRAAQVVARSEDQAAVLDRLLSEIDVLLDGLATR